MKEIGHDNSLFAGDDGSADPALAEALTNWQAGEGDLETVFARLAPTRVLVPVVAVLGETGESTLTGLKGDKEADMALVLLTGPNGQKALPVFTSLQSLHSWNPEARPVPVEARRAALSGVDEGCEVIVVDPAGPATAVLHRPAVWALAQGRDWVSSPRDPEVAGAISEALAGLPQIVETHCEPGRSAELALVLTLVPGLTRPQLDELTQAVSGALSTLPVVAERVASLALRLR